jgi:hypothetical protein
MPIPSSIETRLVLREPENAATLLTRRKMVSVRQSAPLSVPDAHIHRCERLDSCRIGSAWRVPLARFASGR